MPSAADLHVAVAGAFKGARRRAARLHERRLNQTEFGEMIEAAIGYQGEKGGASRNSVGRWENPDSEHHDPGALHLFAALALAGIDVRDLVVQQLADELDAEDLALLRPRGKPK